MSHDARSRQNGPVGRSVRRVDRAGKTTGETRFFSDLYPPDVLWVRTLRSEPGPSGSVHASIRALDASKAESAPGVVRVITAKDVPGENSFGVHVQDQPVLCDGRVRFHGDALALVVQTGAQNPFDDFESLGPFGAKGAGEIVTLPSAAAVVVNAIRDAAGVRVRCTPATPERVFRALQEKAAGVS